MSVREVSVSGHDALTLATTLLQRARRAHPRSGLWEAADVQWWWRAARASDGVGKLFWIDDEGPVAGVLLTSWADAWQCDPIVVPNAAGIEPETVWRRAIELAAEHAPSQFDVPVRDDDRTFAELARRFGLSPADNDSTAWMHADDRPDVLELPAGFVLTARAERRDAPHPMRHRNGEGLAQRLDQCSLYDPALDLAIETTDGEVAGYSLYWFDPITRVGLVEPVRIEDEFQRRGLARVMLSAGIARLAAKGAEQLKISYETDAAAALYQGLGFRTTSTATWYRGTGNSSRVSANP